MIEGHRNNGIGGKILWLTRNQASQAPGEPFPERSHISVLEQQNRARHSGRVRAEAAREVKGVHPAAAKMAQRLRNSPGDRSGNDGPAALGAKRLAERLLEGLQTAMT